MLFTNVRQSCGDCSAGFGLYIAASVQREPQGAVGPIKANISTSACVNQSQAQISGCSHHLSGEKYLSGFEVCTCFECHGYGKFSGNKDSPWTVPSGSHCLVWPTTIALVGLCKETFASKKQFSVVDMCHSEPTCHLLFFITQVTSHLIRQMPVKLLTPHHSPKQHCMH